MSEYKDKVIVKCPNCKEELVVELTTTIDHKLELTK